MLHRYTGGAAEFVVHTVQDVFNHALVTIVRGGRSAPTFSGNYCGQKHNHPYFGGLINAALIPKAKMHTVLCFALGMLS